MPFLKNGQPLTDRYQAICDTCGAKSLVTTSAACPSPDGGYFMHGYNGKRTIATCPKCVQKEQEKEFREQLKQIPKGLQGVISGLPISGFTTTPFMSLPPMKDGYAVQESDINKSLVNEILNQEPDHDQPVGNDSKKSKRNAGKARSNGKRSR